MLVWIIKIGLWLFGNPWSAGVIAGAISLVIGWHVLTERNDRLAQIEAAVQAERSLWQQEVAKEASRQAGVNAEALAAAEKEVARLEAQNVALAANQKEWDREADAAPDANGAWCLSPDWHAAPQPIAVATASSPSRSRRSTGRLPARSRSRSRMPPGRASRRHGALIAIPCAAAARSIPPWFHFISIGMRLLRGLGAPVSKVFLL
jgi:hypothetical protein